MPVNESTCRKEAQDRANKKQLTSPLESLSKNEKRESEREKINANLYEEQRERQKDTQGDG